MFCTKCGKEMDDNAKFCPACGADSTADTVAEQPSSGQTSYSEPAYTEQPESSSGTGVGAMVCGIISLVLCWVPIVGLVLGIVAVVLGGKGKRTLPPDKRGMALAGFIMGIIGMVIGIIMLIAMIAIAVFVGSAISMFGPFMY